MNCASSYPLIPSRFRRERAFLDGRKLGNLGNNIVISSCLNDSPRVEAIDRGAIA